MPEIDFRVRQPERPCILCHRRTDEAADTPGLGWQPAHMTCTSKLWIMYKRWLNGTLREKDRIPATRLWGERAKELTSGS
jgi:hypothetical protein